MPKPDETDPEIETPADPKIETSAAHDPFDDLNSLRLDQSFAEAVGVRKLLRTTRSASPSRRTSSGSTPIRATVAISRSSNCKASARSIS
jgi:hypothetical protein